MAVASGDEHDAEMDRVEAPYGHLDLSVQLPGARK